jgi:phosphatidylserine/phosphatidylglycerophosphate/cardiolipin synthase-like enzyme
MPAPSIKKIPLFRPSKIANRLLAILLSFTFLWPHLTWAFEAPTLSSRMVSGLILNHKPLTVPESVGTVRRVRQGRGKMIIVVQDLHCHYETQMNIAHLLELLSREYGIRLTGVEGAYQTVNTARLRRFPDVHSREAVCSYLVQQGKLSGPEWASATGGEPIRLEGIETPALYEQSLAAVKKFLNDESMGDCEDLKTRFEILETTHCGPAFAAWRAAGRAYQAGQTDLLRFCITACETARRAGLDLTDYPRVDAYSRARAGGEDLDGIHQELERLELTISDRLARTGNERLLLDVTRRVDVIDRILNLAATPEDLVCYRAAPRAFSAEAFLQAAKKLGAAGSDGPRELLALNNYLRQALQFYDLAETRSQEFVRNFEVKMDKFGVRAAVMVVGGYHTKAVLEALDADQTSYALVAPRMTRLDLVNPYFSLLEGEETPMEKLLERNAVLLALRTRLPDTLLSPEKIVPWRQLGSKEAQVFADLSESLMEQMWISRLSRQGRSFHRIAQDCRAGLTGISQEEPNAGLRWLDSLMKDNPETENASFMVIPTRLEMDGQPLKVLARWGRIKPALPAGQKPIEQMTIDGVQLSLLTAEAASLAGRRLSRDSQESVLVRGFKQFLARAWGIFPWRGSDRGAALWSGVEEIFFSGLLVGGFGLLFQCVPLLGGLTAGIVFGMVFSVGIFPWLHRHRVFRLVQSKLIAAPPSWADLLALGVFGFGMRSVYVLLLLALPFGLYNILIGLPAVMALHGLYSAVVAPLLHLPLGRIGQKPALAGRGAGSLTWIEPGEELTRLENVRRELQKELFAPGSGSIPKVVAFSDVHGSIETLDALLLDALRDTAPEGVKLPARLDHAVGLAEQGIRLEQWQGRVFFENLGDLLDKNPHGLMASSRVVELVEAGIAESIMGNHDLYAFMNLLGMHLPAYEGFAFYGYRDEYGDVASLLAQQHRNAPDSRDPRWWEAKLAEYQAYHRSRQSRWEAARVELAKYQDKEDPEWMDFFSALENVGSVSIGYWQDLLKRFEQRREQDDRRRFKKAARLIRDEILPVRTAEFRKQVESGKWWWRVFDAINDGFQRSPEWKAQEWMLRPDYGGIALEEANRIRGPGEPSVSQADYRESPRFRKLAAFFKHQFQLFSRDLYQNHYLHAILPVDPNTKEFVITYKGVEYRGQGSARRPSVWEGLRRIEMDVRDPNATLPDLREAFTLFNQWYLYGTTQTKAPDVARLIRKQNRLEAFRLANGFNRLFTGHVPFTQFLKLDSKMRGQIDGFQIGKRFFAVDHAMLEGGGAAVHMDPQGVELRGFEFGDRQLKQEPQTFDPKGKTDVVFANQGIPRKAFLINVLRDTEARIQVLQEQEAVHKGARRPSLKDWLFGEPEEILAPVAMTGSMPWLRGFFQRLGVSGPAYDRWVAWWLENSMVFAVAGILVGLPLGMATGNPLIAFQAGYLAAWPLFLAGHAWGRGWGRMPVRQRLLVIAIAGINSALLLLFPAAPLAVIAGSFLIHAVANRLGPWFFGEEAPAVEMGRPVWLRQSWMDWVPFLRHALLAFSSVLLTGRFRHERAESARLPSPYVFNADSSVQRFLQAYFSPTGLDAVHFHSGQVQLVPLDTRQAFAFGQLTLDARHRPVVAMPGILLRAVGNQLPSSMNSRTAAWLRWQAARILEYQSGRYQEQLRSSVLNPGRLDAQAGERDWRMLGILTAAGMVFLAPLALMLACHTPSFLGVVCMLLAALSFWQNHRNSSWRKRLHQLIQIIPHAAMTPLLTFSPDHGMAFEQLEQGWQEHSVKTLTRSSGGLRLFRGRTAGKPMRRITHGVELESGLVLPLGIDYGDLDPTSTLYRIWESRRTEGMVLITQQIGLSPVTFLGVLGETSPLTEAFHRQLILSGVGWKHMVSHHLLYVVKGETVEVFFDNQTEPDDKQSRKATELLASVREELARAQQGSKQRRTLFTKLRGLTFFNRLLEKPNREKPALASVVLPHGRLVLAGVVEAVEAENIVAALRKRWAGSWDSLGNIFLSVTGKGVSVIAERPESKALAELQNAAEGMLTVVNFSDTHMADKGRDDNFGSMKEADLLQLIARAAERGSLLIINGDFLELWKTKYGRIRRNYEELFAALRQARRVIYVSGNHDEDILDEFSQKHRRKLVETAKANLLPQDSPQQADFRNLIAACPGFEGKVVRLSCGFPEAGLARENGAWYADAGILEIALHQGSAAAIQRLTKLKEDWEQHLSEMVAQDLGAEIVQYYLDEPRGLYFEHGHISDPFNYQSRSGRIMAYWVGVLERLGWTTAENDLTQLASRLGKWLPIAGLKETSLILQRVLALAGLLRKTCVRVPLTIFFGHTHYRITPDMRGINTFTRELYQTDYVNSGAWSSMGKRQYIIPRSVKRDWQADAGLPDAGKNRAVSIPLDNHRDWFVISPDGRIQFNNGIRGLKFIATVFQSLYHDYPRLTAFVIAPVAEGAALAALSYWALLAGVPVLALGLAVAMAALLAFQAHRRILIAVSPRDTRAWIDGHLVVQAGDGSKYYQRVATLGERAVLFAYFAGMALLPVLISLAFRDQLGPLIAMIAGLAASVLGHILLNAYQRLTIAAWYRVRTLWNHAGTVLHALAEKANALIDQRHRLQIPAGFNPWSRVRLKGAVFDVDLTLTPEGDAVLKGVNLAQLVRALKARVPVLLISGSPVRSEFKVKAYRSDRVADYEEVVMHYPRAALDRRMVAPLLQELAKTGDEAALRQLTVMGQHGVETLTFDSQGCEHYAYDSTIRISPAAQRELGQALAIGYLRRLSALHPEHDFSQALQQIQDARGFNDVYKAFETACRGVSRARFWLFDGEVTIEDEGDNQINGYDALREGLDWLGDRTGYWKQQGIRINAGTDFMKVYLLNKADRVRDWIHRIPGQGAVLGAGDSQIDEFLWEKVSDAKTLYFPFYLGKAEQVRNHAQVIVSRDQQGGDMMLSLGSGQALDHFLTAQEKAQRYGALRFFDNRFSWFELLRQRMVAPFLLIGPIWASTILAGAVLVPLAATAADLWPQSRDWSFAWKLFHRQAQADWFHAKQEILSAVAPLAITVGQVRNPRKQEKAKPYTPRSPDNLLEKRAVAYANNDVAFLAWQYNGKLPDCLGFAIYRTDLKTGEKIPLPAWVGFQNEINKKWIAKDTSVWPVQKFNWRDLTAQRGASYVYEVVPMIGTPGHLQPAFDHAVKTNQVDITPGTGAIRAFFNRGILSTQSLAHRIPQMSNGAPDYQALGEHIKTPGDPMRANLSGQMVEALGTLLNRAKNEGGQCYLALYELSDPEMVQMLAHAPQAHLILSNTGPDDATNQSARQLLHASGMDITDRMLASGHIGHNKFIVYVDKDNRPQAIATGSTNWTSTGLCAQSNNTLIIESPDLAATYLDYWERIKADNAEQGAEFRNRNNQAIPPVVADDAQVQVWFSPNTKQKTKSANALEPSDFAKVAEAIRSAKEAVFFLVFQPGNPSVLDVIAEQQQQHPELFVRGAATDPKAVENFVNLFHGTMQQADEVVAASAVKDQFGYWQQELLKSSPSAHAIIHDKIIVIDPFSDNCTVITGSHNLGYRASYANDENLLIIKGNHQLAQMYAVHAMDIYDHYRWRYQLQKNKNVKKAFYGLASTDAWQDKYFADNGKALKDLLVWFGESKHPQDPEDGPGNSGGNATGSTAPAPGSVASEKNTDAQSVERSLAERDVALKWLAWETYATLPVPAQAWLNYPERIHFGAVSWKKHGFWAWLQGEYVQADGRGGITFFFRPSLYQALREKLLNDQAIEQHDRSRAYFQTAIRRLGLQASRELMRSRGYNLRLAERELTPGRQREAGYTAWTGQGRSVTEKAYWTRTQGMITLTSSQVMRLLLQFLPAVRQESRMRLETFMEAWMAVKPSLTTLLNALDAMPLEKDPVLQMMKALLRDARALNAQEQDRVVKCILASLITLLADPLPMEAAKIEPNFQVTGVQVTGLPREAEPLAAIFPAVCRDLRGQNNPESIKSAECLEAIQALLQAGAGRSLDTVHSVAIGKGEAYGQLLAGALAQLPDLNAFCMGAEEEGVNVFAVNAGVELESLTPHVQVAVNVLLETPNPSSDEAIVRQQVRTAAIESFAGTRLFTRRVIPGPVRDRDFGIGTLLRPLAGILRGRSEILGAAIEGWLLNLRPVSTWKTAVENMPNVLRETVLAHEIRTLDINGLDPVAVAYRQMIHQRDAQSRADFAKVLINTVAHAQEGLTVEARASREAALEWQGFSEFLKGLGGVPMVEIAGLNTAADKAHLPESVLGLRFSIPMALLQVNQCKGALGTVIHHLEQGPFSVKNEVTRLFLRHALMKFGSAA